MLKKLTTALALLAMTGMAQAASITSWDTTDVEFNLGPYEMYTSYINTTHTVYHRDHLYHLSQRHLGNGHFPNGYRCG